MKIAVIAIAALLSGCVSEKTALTNAQGQTVHCDHWGFGLIGAPASMAMHADCMKKAHAAGYSETPAAPTAQSTTAK